MRKSALAVGFLLLATPAPADMYPDASNAAQPAALNNLGKTAGNFYAPAYGTCTWNAGGDVGPCINAALTAAASAGGGQVSLPPGMFGLSTKITWPPTGAVALRCPSGSGSDAPATMLKWSGAAAGRMVEIRAATGAIQGAEIHHCGFDGNHGLAADGLYLASVDHGHFDNLLFTGGFSGGNVVNLTVDSPTGAGSQNNTLDNLRIVNGDGSATSYTSNQLRLGAYMDPADGVHGNAAFNVARNLFITSHGGTGILCAGCDNNYISGRVFNPTVSVDLSIAVAGSFMFPANGNILAPMFYSGPFVARGQTTFPTCVPYPSCTYSNFVAIDETNATPHPTIEPGAGLNWYSNSGYNVGSAFYGRSGTRAGLIAAQDLSLRGSCIAGAGTSPGPQTTAYLCNSENTPYAAFDNVNGSRFAIDNTGVSGAANLRFNRLAGTGNFEFNQLVHAGAGLRVFGMPTVCAGQPTGTLWNDAGTVKICP